MIGQELTKRLHAKTDWPGLYACGDSTTLGMGTPAVVASGFGAANVILREIGKEEYSSRCFEDDHVHYIQESPGIEVPEGGVSSPVNARLVARECQICESQPCRAACPAGTDIAGVIRRIEAGNYAGAARLIRETNPFAEVCGHICSADELCEKKCIRMDFATKPVRIKELHRWVIEYAGEKGWSPPISQLKETQVCVIGAGVTGMTCAHYLSRLGYRVTLLERGAEPGGGLREFVNSGKLPKFVLERDLNGILPSIKLVGNHPVSGKVELEELRKSHAAVFLTADIGVEVEGIRVKGMPNVIVGGRAFTNDVKGYSIAHAVRDGRRAAIVIDSLLREN
jgi:hypothetical protein